MIRTGLRAVLWLGAVGGLVADAGAQTTRADRCDPASCEILLAHVASGSDDNPSLYGGFVNFPVRATLTRDRRTVVSVLNGLAVFSSSGQFVARIGRSGRGPGEFGPLVSPPLVGPGDSIHVVDRLQRRLTVYGPDLGFERAVSAFPAEEVAGILADGTYLVSAQIRAADRVGFPLHTVSRDGQILRSFGNTRPDAPNATQRVASVGPDGTIWALAQGRYVLEEWNPLTGERVRELPVSADWFSESVQPGGDWNSPPAPSLQAVWKDRENILWVLALVAARDWAPPTAQGEFDITPEHRAARFDSLLEAVDPNSGRVLARLRHPNVLWAHPQGGFISSNRLPSGDAFEFDVWSPRLQTRDRR